MTADARAHGTAHLGLVASGFITFGDNDASTDCSHEEFAFDVEISYVDR